MKMTSNKSYLLRAYYDWIVDNSLTPYIVAQANYPGAQIPMQYAEDGRIVLNVSPTAVRNFSATNELVQFQARFSGVVKQVIVPTPGVLGIYAKENGQGIVFPEEELPPQGNSSTTVSISGTTREKPKLTLVKPTEPTKKDD